MCAHADLVCVLSIIKSRPCAHSGKESHLHTGRFDSREVDITREVENPKEPLLSDDENRNIPERPAFPLNSLQLKASHIQQNTKSLLLPTGGTTSYN